MITYEEAMQLASPSSKYAHSLRVSSLMHSVAEQLGADTSIWMLVGLLHDLDYDETVNDRSLHGVATARRLEGKLPRAALNALSRHDHRTGLVPETNLDHSLILCDVVAIILELNRLETPVPFEVFLDCLESVSCERPWLNKLVNENLTLDRVELAGIFDTE